MTHWIEADRIGIDLWTDRDRDRDRKTDGHAEAAAVDGGGQKEEQSFCPLDDDIINRVSISGQQRQQRDIFVFKCETIKEDKQIMDSI